MTITDSELKKKVNPAPDKVTKSILIVPTDPDTGRSDDRGAKFCNYVAEQGEIKGKGAPSNRQRQVLREMGTAKNADKIINIHLGRLEETEREYESVFDLWWEIAETVDFFWDRCHGEDDIEGESIQHKAGLTGYLMWTYQIDTYQWDIDWTMEKCFRLVREANQKSKWNSLSDREVINKVSEEISTILILFPEDEISREKVRDYLEKELAKRVG